MSIAAAIKKPKMMNIIVFQSFNPFFAFRRLTRLRTALFLTARFKGWYFSGFD